MCLADKSAPETWSLRRLGHELSTWGLWHSLFLYCYVYFALCMLQVDLKTPIKPSQPTNQIKLNQSPSILDLCRLNHRRKKISEKNLSVTKLCLSLILNVWLELDCRSWLLVKNLSLLVTERITCVAPLTSSVSVVSKVDFFVIYVLTLAPSLGPYVIWSCVM